jgi:hypothetical protein
MDNGQGVHCPLSTVHCPPKEDAVKALVIVFVIAAGCAATPPPRIVPMDRETFRVESPRVGVRADERLYVSDAASQFCASRKKEVEPVLLTDIGPDGAGTSRLPTAARATLLFKCVARTPGT